MTKLKIIHHNIRGINIKLTELTLFVNKHKPDIITLNETLTIKNNTYIPNYKITYPSPNPGRGVAIIHKHDLTIEQLPTITTTEPTTNLHHAILIHSPTESIQVATIYCPPKNPFHEIINTICTRHIKTIITGDFNCRHENFGHETADKDGKLLVQYTEQHNYTKINDNEPTYINDTTGKEDVKDVKAPKMMETFQDFWVDEDLGSDHRAIIATFSSQPLTHDKPKKKILLYHKADWTAINNTITNEMTRLHLEHTSSTEAIDNYTSALTSVIQTTIMQSVPQIDVKTHSTGIDKTTQDLITEKKQLRKLWQRTRIQHYKTEYNKLNNTIKHRIKTIKTKNWHNICNDLELTDNQDNTWHQLKKILKLNKPYPTFPTLITYDKDNNKIRSTTTEQKIDTFTSTFENIFTHDDPSEHYNINFKEQIATNLKLNEKLINTLPTISPNYLTHKYAITTKLIENTINSTPKKHQDMIK